MARPVPFPAGLHGPDRGAPVLAFARPEPDLARLPPARDMVCPIMPCRQWRRVLLAVVLVGMIGGTRASAGTRTDVVTLLNGDRITGEIKKLERGRLEFKTDDVGTLYIEWDKIGAVAARGQFEVALSDGSRYVGALVPGAPKELRLAGEDASVALPMTQVTLITPIGATFWSRLDGSFDAGFSYTRSSDIAQLNVNSETIHRRARSEARLAASATLTKQREGGVRDDRGAIDASYLRYLSGPWFVSAGTRFESNESLGVRLRSQVGAVAGPRLVDSNRAQVFLGAGVVFNDERAVDAPSARNVEAMVLARASYFTYDRPKTNLDLSLQYFPSLSNGGRHRLQLDAAARREVWKDFYLSVNGFDTYDSHPPNPAFDSNDVGVVLSLGWSY